jgi:hypothetical protein
MTEPLVTGKTKRELAPLKAAFWPNVITGPRDTCWHWRKSVGSSDYGVLSWRGRAIPAHRVSLALALGRDIPDGAFVCHHCDNPRCFNPHHLFLGTHKDNMQDKARKGRTPKFNGDKGPRCKLTMEQAMQARYLRKTGVSAKQLAVQFGISLSSIKTLLANKSYFERAA